MTLVNDHLESAHDVRIERRVEKGTRRGRKPILHDPERRSRIELRDNGVPSLNKSRIAGCRDFLFGEISLDFLGRAVIEAQICLSEFNVNQGNLQKTENRSALGLIGWKGKDASVADKNSSRRAPVD